MVFCYRSQNGLRQGLIKTQVAGSHLRISDSVGLGWGLKIDISNKFPSDAYADDASLEILLRELLF